MFFWLAPIFFLLVLGFASSGLLQEEPIVEPFDVALVNDDPTFETKLVIRQLTEGAHLNKLMKTEELEAAEAKVMLENNEIAAIIYIPKGFSKDVARGKNTPVTVTGNSRRPLQSQLVRYVMESAAGFTSAAQSGINTVDEFMGEDFSIQERKSEFKSSVVSFGLHVLGRGEIYEEHKQTSLFQQNLLQYYVFSFYLLLIMIWSLIGLLLLKRNGNEAVRRRLLSMGITEFDQSVTKLLTVYLLSAFSSLAAAGILFAFEVVRMPDNMGAFIVFVLLAALGFSSFFVMLEAIIKNEKLFFFMAILVLLFGTIAGGHIIPVIYFPEWLEQMSMASLNFWMMQILPSFFHGTAPSNLPEILSFLALLPVVCLLLSKAVLTIQSGRGK